MNRVSDSGVQVGAGPGVLSVRSAQTRFSRQCMLHRCCLLTLKVVCPCWCSMALAAPTELTQGQLSTAGSFAASSEEQARAPWLSEHAAITADPVQAQQSSIVKQQQGDGLADFAEDALQAAAVVDWVAQLDFDAYLRWVSRCCSCISVRCSLLSLFCCTYRDWNRLASSSGSEAAVPKSVCSGLTSIPDWGTAWQLLGT